MRRWLLLLTLLIAGPAQAARLTGLSITPGIVTIAADTAPASASQFALDAPYRLVVDLPQVSTPALAAHGAGSVTALRAAQFQPGIARLVLDLAGPLEIVAATAGPAGLTLTLRRVSADQFAIAVARGRRALPIAPLTASTPAPIPAASAPAADFALPDDLFRPPEPAPPEDSPALAAPAPEIPQNLAPRRPHARSGGKPLVVIDAGHGGKDTGAISVGGGYEKTVTLAIARATARRLERGGKVRVLLTRSDDRFIPLGGRVTIARLARADLFISIHADAAANAEARGASVYTLSAVASDAVAARLAARENKSDIIGGVNLGVEAPEVGDIMIDLSRRATGNVSVAFAETLQESLSERLKFRGEFHHFAGFRVLKAPDVPSVLLETGYVTNSEDSKFLFSESGRRRIAEGIARAIERHLTGD